jgi:hypothetical protein
VLLATVDAAGASARTTPLPVLASLATEHEEVNGAFDVCVIAPEILADEMADAENRESLERWSYNASFEVHSSDGADLVASTSLGKVLLGDLEIHVDLDDPDRPVRVSGPEAGAHGVVALCEVRRWQTQYGSGHTSTEALLQRPNVPFNGWQFRT